MHQGKRTVHEKLNHMFYLAWKRDERINRRLRLIMSVYEDLTREVAETREAVMTKLAAMQVQIDILTANPADVAAVTAAAAELDRLQSDVTGVVDQPAPTPEPDPDPNNTDPIDPNIDPNA